MTVDRDRDGAVPGASSSAGADSATGDADQDQLRRDVAKLSRTVRELSATVTRLSGATPVDLAEPDPSDGSDRNDGDAGEDLVEWVQWLVARYELDNVPDCWTHHGALVEELDALRIGWLDTIGRGQGGLAAMQWHDYFGRTLERFDRRWRARNCEDTHRDTILPGWVTKDSGALDVPDIDAGRYRP